MRERVIGTRSVSLGVVIAVSACTLGYVTGAAAQPEPRTINLPQVLSGENIGFLPAREGSRVGKLMIRIDGKWVEAQLGPGMQVLPAK